MFYNNGYNQDWSTLKKLVWLRGNPATGQIGTSLTVSGTPPLSLPNSLGKPLKAWSVELSPYQDLHGYDAPWPAGGGKNKFDKDAITDNAYLSTTTGLPEPTSSYCISDYIPVKSGVSVYIPRSDSVRRWFYALDKTPTTYLNNGGNQQYTPTEDGYIRVSIDKRTISLDAYQIELGSSATSYAPYSNLCPILGTDKVTVWTSGKNLLDKSTLIANSYVKDDGTFAFSEVWSRTGYLELPSGEYVASGLSAGGSNAYICSYDANKQPILASITAIIANTDTTFTIPENGKYVALSVRTGDGSADTAQLEFGSTATEYTPYIAPSSTAITLPQTVYTGTIGSEGGESGWGYKEFNGTENWVSSSQGFYCQLDALKRTSNYLNLIMCDKLTTFDRHTAPAFLNSTQGITGWNGAAYPGQNWIYAKAPDCTTVAQFKTWLSENPITVIYELTDPVQISLTAPTIPTPTGTATTWATAEDGTVDGMEVTYVGKA